MYATNKKGWLIPNIRHLMSTHQTRQVHHFPTGQHSKGALGDQDQTANLQTQIPKSVNQPIWIKTNSDLLKTFKLNFAKFLTIRENF